MAKMICADYGGKTAAGKPCNRPVTTEGPCRSHRPEVAEKMNSKKKAILERLEDPTIAFIAACNSVGIAEVTFWRWRQTDKAFSEAVKTAEDKQDSSRVKIVEDTLFKRLATGKASPTEMVFYLMNRAPDRWKDKRNVEHTTKDGEPLAIKIYLPDNARNGS